MSTNNTQQTTFLQFLQKHTIEIPIIQRDYAQGREGKEKLREKFLGDLKHALDDTLPNNEKVLKLDFIYESIENDNLNPLDGQQRLTTLWLLHWFIAYKAGKLAENKEVFKRFTYKTRVSSREFCNKLSEFTETQPIETGIVAHITNQTWFFLAWKQDPTIQAMLNMLGGRQHKDKKYNDGIEKLFKNSNENTYTKYWEQLTKAECPIIFYHLPLYELKLSDDLYIKMNARGKQLTAFENIKADLVGHIKEQIKEQGWEESKNPQETFSHKIDTVWTDLFWKYRKKIETKDDKIINYSIDEQMSNFIAGIAINCYAQNLEIKPNEENEEKIKKELEKKDKTKTVSDDAIKRERIEKRIVALFNNPNEITPDDFSTEKAFKYLVDCFDKYAEKRGEEFSNADLKSAVDLWKYCGDTLFKDLILKEESEWKARTLFFAQTIYLLETTFNQNSYNDWMRVIRNITENSTIESAKTFIAAINLIKELSAGCSGIYDYLFSKYTLPAQIHAQKQLKEEIEKAKIITTKPDAKQVIHDTEDKNFCKGKIDFALYCSGYNIDKKPDIANFNKNKLEEVKDVIATHLTEKNIEDDFKRALLTVRDNSYYNVWGTWSHSFKCQKRLLLSKNDDLKNHLTDNKYFRGYLKDLVVQLVDKDKDCKQICQNFVIPNGMPKWKQRLIKEDGLLEGATFILIPIDDSYCKLAWQQRPSREEQVKKIE